MKVAYLLMAAYAFTLAMSSAHLASWYATTLGELPLWLAWGLAGALELTAFLLSLVSTSILRGSRWAGAGAFAALALVWAGNAISMHRAASHLALWEVLAMSSFVPIGTFVVGKVVGELLERVEPKVERRGRAGTSLDLPPVPPPNPKVEHRALKTPPPGTQVDPLPGPSEGGVEQEAPQVEQEAPQVEQEALQAFPTEEERATAILNALAVLGPASVSRLANELGWPKSSTHRWLERLARHGWVRKGAQGWEVVR